MTTRVQLIPPAPPDSPYVPKGRRLVPVLQDLAEHRPIVSYDDGGDFAGQLDDVHRAAALLVHNPVRDVAMAIEALTYAEKSQVAVALRTTVTRLNAWADLVLER
jgi:hypothetical protein